MKIFAILLLSLCIFRCSTPPNTSSSQTQATNSSLSNDKSFESYEPLSLYGDVWLFSQFNEIGLAAPTTINFFIGETNNEIGFIYENLQLVRKKLKHSIKTNSEIHTFIMDIYLR